MAIVKRWWLRIVAKAADATVGAVVSAVLALIGPYFATFMPVVGGYMTTRLAFVVPAWVLSSFTLLAIVLVVGGLLRIPAIVIA